MPKRYFRKEIPDSPVYILGKPMRFDVLETEDVTLINELLSCILRQAGGIIEITAEEFAVEAQKKTSKIDFESNFRPNPSLRRRELSAPNPSGHPAVGVGAGGRPVEAGFFGSQMAPGGPGVLPASGRPLPAPIQVPSDGAFKSQFKRPPSGRANGETPPAT